MPIVDAWVNSRHKDEHKVFKPLYKKFFEENDLLEWAKGELTMVMTTNFNHISTVKWGCELVKSVRFRTHLGLGEQTRLGRKVWK